MALMFLGTVASAVNPEHVRVLSTRMDIVYLKVPMDMVGASVTVYDAHGVRVFDQSVTGRKVVVDFIDKRPGNK